MNLVVKPGVFGAWRWVLVALLAVAWAPGRAESTLLVFAAASLKPVLTDLLARPDAREFGPIDVSYAASSQLARQIEAGAPAALFVSADEDWMDELARHDAIVATSRIDLLGNALVLIAPTDSDATIDLAQPQTFIAALGADGHLALAEPDSVPAGRYAKAALRHLGIWDSVRGRIVATQNVRAALALVARREVPLGVVYRTDAQSEPAVRTVATFPPSSHPPIVYPAAIVAGHDSDATRAFLAWLRSPAAVEVFRAYGFDDPPARP